MAVREQREVYSHATIDCSDMTLTEYDVEILERWAGVPNIEIEIRQSTLLPAEEG